MVLAMHGDPLAGTDARGDPHQEAEHLADRPADREGAVRQAAVEVHRRAEVGQQRDREAGEERDEERVQHARSVPSPTDWSVGAPLESPGWAITWVRWCRPASSSSPKPCT